MLRWVEVWRPAQDREVEEGRNWTAVLGRILGTHWLRASLGLWDFVHKPTALVNASVESKLMRGESELQEKSSKHMLLPNPILSVIGYDPTDPL